METGLAHQRVRPLSVAETLWAPKTFYIEPHFLFWYPQGQRPILIIQVISLLTDMPIYTHCSPPFQQTHHTLPASGIPFLDMTIPFYNRMEV